ncbi:hypothetical protein O1611_g8354 [Lasiodiplodia mahajangana]|uniref:Uncharacterized protein n=1 Tax=Lasiodiplodia mahajangana TaxID=1108764 RepID=A0ACC2JCV1_9PEZI|nr:hypothetical protein O1611_g8354 [Lasiodiplodia mahajangana]
MATTLDPLRDESRWHTRWAPLTPVPGVHHGPPFNFLLRLEKTTRAQLVEQVRNLLESGGINPIRIEYDTNRVPITLKGNKEAGVMMEDYDDAITIGKALSQNFEIDRPVGQRGDLDWLGEKLRYLVGPGWTGEVEERPFGSFFPRTGKKYIINRLIDLAKTGYSARLTPYGPQFPVATISIGFLTRADIFVNTNMLKDPNAFGVDPAYVGTTGRTIKEINANIHNPNFRKDAYITQIDGNLLPDYDGVDRKPLFHAVYGITNQTAVEMLSITNFGLIRGTGNPACGDLIRVYNWIIEYFERYVLWRDVTIDRMSQGNGNLFLAKTKRWMQKVERGWRVFLPCFMEVHNDINSRGTTSFRAYSALAFCIIGVNALVKTSKLHTLPGARSAYWNNHGDPRGFVQQSIGFPNDIGEFPRPTSLLLLQATCHRLAAATAAAMGTVSHSVCPPDFVHVRSSDHYPAAQDASTHDSCSALIPARLLALSTMRGKVVSELVQALFVIGDAYAKEAARRHPKTREQAHKRNTEFCLTERIHESESQSLRHPPDPAHSLVVTLEPDDFTEEKYAVYENYQRIVHQEAISEISRSGFTKFLCNSPLTRETVTMSDGREKRLGSYHQCYRLDGRLVAIGVLDLLPYAVSSVYFLYHESIHDWSPGKLGALREIALAIEGKYRWWYPGFYIHTCPKMRYKMDYSPKHILNPDDMRWIEVSDEVLAKFDSHGYLDFSSNGGDRVTNSNQNEEDIAMDNETSLENEESDSNSSREYISLLDSNMPGLPPMADIVSYDYDSIPVRLRAGIFPAVDVFQWQNEHEDIRHGAGPRGQLAQMAAAVGLDVMPQLCLDIRRV